MPLFAGIIYSSVGAWTGGTVYYENADSSWSRTFRGFMIFTEKHYSMMYSLGKPRPVITDETTDEEKLRIFSNFTADAGDYKLEGNKVNRQARLSKKPNVMQGDEAPYPDLNIHKLTQNEVWFSGKYENGTSWKVKFVRAKNEENPD